MIEYELFKGRTGFAYTVNVEKGVLIVDANGGEYVDEIPLKIIFDEICAMFRGKGK